MLFGVFGFLNFVLGFYSNVAIAWIGAVVADLVVNKPFLKVSPSYVEFKRAYLYQINPVGFGAMAAGAAVSIPAFFGLFGEYAQAFSPYLALTIAFFLSPVLALITKGSTTSREGSSSAILESDEERYVLTTCGRCGQEYEAPEMARCTFHETPICSLLHPGEELPRRLQEAPRTRQEARRRAGLRIRLARASGVGNARRHLVRPSNKILRTGGPLWTPGRRRGGSRCLRCPLAGQA